MFLDLCSSSDLCSLTLTLRFRMHCTSILAQVHMFHRFVVFKDFSSLQRMHLMQVWKGNCFGDLVGGAYPGQQPPALGSGSNSNMLTQLDELARKESSIGECKGSCLCLSECQPDETLAPLTRATENCIFHCLADNGGVVHKMQYTILGSQIRDR